MHSRYAPWCPTCFALAPCLVARTLLIGSACCHPRRTKGASPRLHKLQQCSAFLPTAMHFADVHSQRHASRTRHRIPAPCRGPARPHSRPHRHPGSQLPSPTSPVRNPPPCAPTALQYTRSLAPSNPISKRGGCRTSPSRFRLITPALLRHVSRHGQHVLLWAHHHRVVVVAYGARLEAARGTRLLHHVHHQLHALDGRAVEHAVLHAVVQLRACMSTAGGRGVQLLLLQLLLLCGRYRYLRLDSQWC